MKVRYSFKRYASITTSLVLIVLCIRFTIQPPCIPGVVPIRHFQKFEGDDRIPSDVTVVTAFFDLGSFKKGERGDVFGPNLYLQWAGVYHHLQNPLVVYTDSNEFIKLFMHARSHLQNITQIIKIEKANLATFKYLAKIASIYSDPSYPKYHPNTVIPEYACVQHAKYACMEKALDSDYFKTKHFMWLDIGYFRYLTSHQRDFRMVLPRGFDGTKIAMNQVNLGYSMKETPEDIFRGNYVWMGGGLSIGEKAVFRMFIRDYWRALERYLSLNLSNTDQQVLFAMYTEPEIKVLKPSVFLQPYIWDTWGSCWFYLGYQCYREMNVNQKTTSVIDVQGSP